MRVEFFFLFHHHRLSKNNSHSFVKVCISPSLEKNKLGGLSRGRQQTLRGLLLTSSVRVPFFSRNKCARARGSNTCVCTFITVCLRQASIPPLVLALSVGKLNVRLIRALNHRGLSKPFTFPFFNQPVLIQGQREKIFTMKQNKNFPK